MKKVVIVDGLRTAYTKAWTDFAEIPAQDLGSIAARELLIRNELAPELLNEVIIGSIAQPPEAANVARIIALQAGLPLLFYDAATRWFARLSKAKSIGQRLASFMQFRFNFLNPIIALQLGLTDGYCGLNMGETAEILAKEFRISREEQDRFAMESHLKAERATENNILREEIVPVPVPPHYDRMIDEDNGIRKGQSMEALARLRPVFDRVNGTVTAGNASQITDGAAVVLVMEEERAMSLGYKPLGRIRSFAFSGLDPARMGLGPAFATPV
jgi:acetyl-CoA acetyltransferase